jgi:hypothetical protein
MFVWDLCLLMMQFYCDLCLLMMQYYCDLCLLMTHYYLTGKTPYSERLCNKFLHKGSTQRHTYNTYNKQPTELVTDINFFNRKGSQIQDMDTGCMMHSCINF